MAAQLKRKCSAFVAHSKKRSKLAPPDFTAAELYDWTALQEQGSDVWQCQYCRNPIGIDLLQFDHRVPLAWHTRRVSMNDLTICCKRCNQLKGQMSGDAFDVLLKAIKTMDPSSVRDLESRLLGAGRYRRR